MSDPRERETREATADEACAREAIHLAEAIQPHGWLLVADIDQQRLTHVSANCGSLFPSTTAQAMLGQPLANFLEQQLVDACIRTASAGAGLRAAQFLGTYNIGDMAALCDVSVHLVDRLLHIEIERSLVVRTVLSFTTRAHLLATRSAGLAGDDDFNAFMVTQLRALTGFDRVMLYRFRHDYSGEVIAEDVDPAMEPWLGQRYPASDIPAQARALYLRNRIRIIPDTGYTPVPVLRADDASAGPLDMSLDVLRSVSPVHRQYLHNMQVGASMSISVLVGDALWGMLLFQHRVPRSVTAEARNMLDLLAALVSVRVGARRQVRQRHHLDQLDATRAITRIKLQAAADPLAALRDELPLLQQLLPNDGIALLDARGCTSRGDLLDDAKCALLRDWLAAQPAEQPLAWTHVAQWHDGPSPHGALAGVLALRLPDARWLLYLRKAYDEEIRWAGIPDKQVQPQADGSVQIAPRADFSVWRELLRGHSEPWSNEDLHSAQALHGELNALLNAAASR